MAEKSHYNYRVEPQDVDFTLRATIPSLGSAILNTAGVDAHGKGFGVDALNADNHSWVLSRMAVEFDSQPTQYTDYTIATWINEYGRVLSTRNFTLTDAAGTEFGRAVTQWAMIDLQSRSAIDLSWVGDAHADAIVDAAPPTDKPRKIRAVSPTATAEHRVVYSDIDFPMIRLGEIYLIYAEACMNLGQANTALPKLKELTDRAGVSAPSSVTADYLLEERARELMWEGHRRTDLIRYGKFTTPSFLWTYKGGTFTGQGFDDYMKIFAIPSSELASNPELHQNPGYGNATDK